MIQKTIKQISKMIKLENSIAPFETLEIKGVTIDSRKIEKGNLFIPFIGENVDGHRYVEEALQNGAAASLWQKDVPNPPENLQLLIVEDTLVALQELARSYRAELQMKIIGITGSNGKTTTKDMAANLLALKYKVQKTEGNFNNHIGLPLTVLGLNKETEMAVLEMGMSNKGEIDFLTKLAQPHAVIITNIGESHLLDLGSREGIAAAKLEIINGLQPDGLVVYHGDEPLLAEQLEKCNGANLVQTFGCNEANTLYPLKIEPTAVGSTFYINKSDRPFMLPVLGTYNILNALAAMLVAHHYGVPYEQMNEGLATLKLTNMRMELVEGRSGEKIINDAYNASPTSMKAAIDLVTNLSGYEKKILVLGDMLELGPDEQIFHKDIGVEIDHEKINYVFTFGELGEWIAAGAREVFPENRVFSFLEKEELIAELATHLDEQTLILVKASRGMKMEEIVRKLL